MMLFDIRTPDSAYDFLQVFLGITYGEFIKEYVVECNNDFDLFWEKWANRINSTSIDNLEFVVIHVTSNKDNCLEIKTNGIKNLKLVLSENSTLKNELQQNGIDFDIKNKTLQFDSQTFDITYENYCGRYNLTKLEKKIERISHKIYYDFQVNGFFSNNDVTKYGTNIHKRPEFIYNLVEMLPQLKEFENKWIEEGKGYIIIFRAPFHQFAWFTFYDEKHNYVNDLKSKQYLKKWILSQVISRSFDSFDSHSQIFAYMDAEAIVSPKQIIDIQEIV